MMKKITEIISELRKIYRLKKLNRLLDKISNAQTLFDIEKHIRKLPNFQKMDRTITVIAPGQARVETLIYLFKDKYYYTGYSESYIESVRAAALQAIHALTSKI